MRTNNEKILLALLVGIVFIWGNYEGYQWLMRQHSSLQLTYAQLKADQAEAEVDLQKSGLWARRKEWIQQHEPTLGNEGDAKAQLLEDVLKGARAQQLEILEQSLSDVQHGSGGTRVDVELKVKGSMQGLCNWLTDLQKPEAFYAVTHFSLKADEDQKSMVCTLQLARYFK